MRLAQRLLAGSAILIGVLVLLIVVLSGQRLRQRLGDLTKDRLTREARLIAVEWRPGSNADSLADAAGRALGHRVTLIDSTGRVIGDSEFDGPALARLQNHATRPEVLAATRGEVGTALRVSPSEGDEELYVALRTAQGVARVSLGTRQLEEIVSSGRRDVLLSGLAALVIALALAAVFSRQVSRPVVELRDVAQAIAAGDLSRRPALSAPGEVGDLASAVHRMSEQLDSRLRAVQDEDALLGALVESLHEGVIAVDPRRQVIRVNERGRRFLALDERLPFSADLLPRDRALRESLASAMSGRAVDGVELPIAGRMLALTARPLPGGGAVLAFFDLTALRRMEVVRRDFVANVSHELKTPLTVVRGFAETLVTDAVSEDERRQFAAAIRSNADRMHRLVDDLLDLSRIESGGWVPSPADVSASAAASDAAAPYLAVAESRRIRLLTAIDPDACTVHADATALRHVLGNLIENAVRYTNEGGEVTVFARAGEHGVWVGTRDTGIGIAPEHLSRIFERFYRVDSARARSAGGTGLGLAIVRHLVEAHGGRVQAESTPGVGTTVSAFFPITPAPRSE